MRVTVAVLLLVGSLMAFSVANAGPDDVKWIAQCMQDNANANVAPEVVSKYCTCMNYKMDNNETQSITQWEKTHQTERAECDKESGWK
jgi:hypothetical protein